MPHRRLEFGSQLIDLGQLPQILCHLLLTSVLPSAYSGAVLVLLLELGQLLLLQLPYLSLIVLSQKVIVCLDR